LTLEHTHQILVELSTISTGAAPTTAVQIRNHILAVWRGDVTQYLSEEAAAAHIQPRHRHVVAAAWRFLDREGYINWGVAPAITDRALQEKPETVVVIGAGLAGVLILEQAQLLQ